MEINITNEDCMELLARTPDKFYDLAIVDPPYQDTAANLQSTRGKHTDPKRIRARGVYSYEGLTEKKPGPDYFAEIRRVSKNQIVWGGNYFTDILPVSRGWIFWDKDANGIYSDGELAWTSFDEVLRKVLYVWDGFRQGVKVGDKTPKGSTFATGNKQNIEKRIHATQKPIALYEWLLRNYAKPGQTILDTHMGSGSIAIAAYNLGYDLTACELDTDYYAAAMKRLQAHIQKHPRGEDLLPKRVTLNNQLPLEFFTQ
jgi:site-specific DNA-methyltransferase (adenine-specific)